MMGCDGIWETMSNQEVADFVSERIEKKIPIQQILSEFLDKNLASDTSSTFFKRPKEFTQAMR